MKVKKESEKAGLKLSMQKTKIMDLVPSLHGKQMGTIEAVTDFIFLGSKITADDDCSHEIKRRIDSVLKSRDITLLTKVHKSKL